MRVTDTKYARVQSGVRWLRLGATGADSQGKETSRARKQSLLPTFDVGSFKMLSQV